MLIMALKKIRFIEVTHFLKDRAIEFHHPTGVPNGPCGLQEIQNFQDYYDGFSEVNVLSFHQKQDKSTLCIAMNTMA